MPELPEVETICWRLREGGQGEAPLRGRVITDVALADPGVVDGDSAAFVDGLRGARVQDIRRRAKWIIIDVDDRGGRRRRVLVHLKMTGDLHVRAGDERPRFERFAWELDDGARLCFTDPRRFGHVELLAADDDVEARFTALGPEPLDETFTARALRARLTGRRPIKASLLDQAVVAGVGNIYADESLWLARLPPTTPTNALSDDEVVRLHHGIRRATGTQQRGNQDVGVNDGPSHQQRAEQWMLWSHRTASQHAHCGRRRFPLGCPLPSTGPHFARGPAAADA